MNDKNKNDVLLWVVGFVVVLLFFVFVGWANSKWGNNSPVGEPPVGGFEPYYGR